MTLTASPGRRVGQDGFPAFSSPLRHVIKVIKNYYNIVSFRIVVIPAAEQLRCPDIPIRLGIELSVCRFQSLLMTGEIISLSFGTPF